MKPKTHSRGIANQRKFFIQNIKEPHDNRVRISSFSEITDRTSRTLANEVLSICRRDCNKYRPKDKYPCQFRGTLMLKQLSTPSCSGFCANQHQKLQMAYLHLLCRSNYVVKYNTMALNKLYSNKILSVDSRSFFKNKSTHTVLSCLSEDAW